MRAMLILAVLLTAVCLVLRQACMAHLAYAEHVRPGQQQR